MFLDTEPPAPYKIRVSTCRPVSAAPSLHYAVNCGACLLSRDCSARNPAAHLLCLSARGESLLGGGRGPSLCLLALYPSSGAALGVCVVGCAEGRRWWDESAAQEAAKGVEEPYFATTLSAAVSKPMRRVNGAGDAAYPIPLIDRVSSPLPAILHVSNLAQCRACEAEHLHCVL